MKESKSEHYNFLELFSVQDGCIVIGKQKVTDIISNNNDTPTFIYDHEVIDSKIKGLKKYLPSSIEIHYAIKANPMPELIKHIQPQINGLDIASGKELQLALESGAQAGSISFASPGKSNEDLLLAIKSGITINLESENEFKRVVEISNRVGITANAALRINPNFELKSSGMKMSGGSKPFGVDSETAAELINRINNSSINFQGLLIYSGSQNLKHVSIIESQIKTFELAAELSRQTNTKIRQLNIGGGFGIPYFPGEHPLDLKPIGDNLFKLIEKYSDDFSNTQIIIELGRYLVGECGIYLCKIIDKKISRGKTFLVVNGGLHHHLAASGNLGQVIRKNFPVTVANKIGFKIIKANVVGPLCTPLDILAENLDLPEANIGDYIAVFNSGAYGYSASPINFLSHPHPNEIFI